MKLGIVGTGMIAHMIVPHLGAWGIEVGALCSTPRSEAKAAELAKPYQARVYTKLDDLLSDARIDTVYIAVPNHLHFETACQALAADKNVILEKPLTSTVEEALALRELAHARKRYLLEAVTTPYLASFKRVKSLLPQIGRIHIATANYSQRSSRYDAFLEGKILPAFDPTKSGGALMDLGVYNLHYLVGLFGSPREIRYEANIERDIDTSGLLFLDYGGFKAVSIAAKDSASASGMTIQGSDGYLMHKAPGNQDGVVELHRKDGSVETYREEPHIQWEAEFREFNRIISEGDWSSCEACLVKSISVSQILTDARASANIYFPADDAAPDVSSLLG